MIKKVVIISFIGMVAILLAVEGLAYYISMDRPSGVGSFKSAVGVANLSGDGRKPIKGNKALRQRLSHLSPKGVYIVIDTAQNLLLLREGNKTILQATISSGSGNILKDPDGERQWVFDTPRGEFEVKGKIRGPSWIKPDWAFIEEGKDIPKDWKERVEEGVLGDYALAFGNGYFIHGTLYTRLLGRNVTHGCIRVGDEDLESIYRLSNTGTKIFIF